jgi:hypothetical protein
MRAKPLKTLGLILSLSKDEAKFPPVEKIRPPSAGRFKVGASNTPRWPEEVKR